MKITLFIVLGLISLFVVLRFFLMRKLKNMPSVDDHSAIKQLSASNFKPFTSQGITIVDFWAPWCGPCKMMAPVFNEVAEAANSKFKVAKVNVDEQQALGQQFKIRSIPTTIILKHGKEVKRFAGIKSKAFFLKEIESL